MTPQTVAFSKTNDSVKKLPAQKDDKKNQIPPKSSSGSAPVRNIAHTLLDRSGNKCAILRN